MLVGAVKPTRSSRPRTLTTNQWFEPSRDVLNGVGVRGVSMSASGGYGEGPGIGVLGNSGTGMAVQGFSSGEGTGVNGESERGVGIRGFTNRQSSIGVWALNALGGRALAVGGKAEFDTAGAGRIPAGQIQVSCRTGRSRATATSR